ncbi:MAG: hypothetical protein ACK4WB_04425 [Desulfatiglandales bacterium]
MAPPIPYIEAVPGPPFIFLLLNLFTFFFHLIAMNLLLGGNLLLCFDSKLKEFISLTNGSKLIPVVFAFTVNLGIAPLLFLQVLYGHFFYTSSILMAWFWIALIPILIAAYYSVYILTNSSRFYLNKPILISISLLILWVAFLFCNNMTAMISPENFINYFHNQKGTLLNLKERMLWPRYLHFVVASLAITYLFVAFWAHFKKEELKGNFLRKFSNLTFVQLLIGLWLLFSLNSEVLGRLFSSPDFIIIFLIGSLCGVVSLIEARRNNLKGSILFTILALLSMVIVRHYVRSSYLAPYFKLGDLTKEPQPFNLFLFLAVFFIGFLVVGWLMKIGFSGARSR